MGDDHDAAAAAALEAEFWRCRDLNAAVERGDLGAVQALVRGEPPTPVGRPVGRRGFTPLTLAVSEGHVAIARWLIEEGGAGLGAGGVGERTPLSVAAARGHIELVRYLAAQDMGAMEVRGLGARTPLHAAVIEGHRDIVALLLDLGADIEATCYGRTPLMSAITHGRHEIALVLLERGANIQAIDGKGQTPLHHAAKKNNHDMARVLLDRGARVDVPDKRGRMPLHRAAEKRAGEVIRLLLERDNADVNARNAQDAQTALHVAASSRSVDTVSLLLEHGAQADPRDNSQRTPLHLAAVIPHDCYLADLLACIECLLGHGADADAKGPDGRNVLSSIVLTWKSWASDDAYEVPQELLLNITRVLLAHGSTIDETAEMQLESTHGAETSAAMRACLGHWRRQLARAGPEATGSERSTLLSRVPVQVFRRGAQAVNAFFDALEEHDSARERHEPAHEPQECPEPQAEAIKAWQDAIEANDVDAVGSLLQRGLPLEVRWDGGTTPLLLAIRRGHVAIAELLIESGAAVDPCENSGDLEPPLVAAASTGNLELVRLLVDRGAHLEAASAGGGMTATHLAAFNHHLGIVRYLAERGAKLQVKTDNALHFTCSSNDDTTLDTLRCLLQHGADPEALDVNGGTALFWSTLSTDATKLLLEHGARATARDKNASTPLHASIAVTYPSDINVETLRVLVEHGADVNAVDAHGVTPLHLAIKAKRIDVTRFLLEHGARPDVVSAEGETPLSIATVKQDVDAVRLLLDNGAHTAPEGACNALHEAVIRCQLEITRLLLEHGADVHVPNECGLEVLSSAMRTWDVWGINYRAACDWYLYEEPDPDDLDTCLQIARCLMEHGATLDAATSEELIVQHGEDYAPCFRVCLERWARQRSGGAALVSPVQLLDVPTSVFKRGAEALDAFFDEQLGPHARGSGSE